MGSVTVCRKSGQGISFLPTYELVDKLVVGPTDGLSERGSVLSCFLTVDKEGEGDGVAN